MFVFSLSNWRNKPKHGKFSGGSGGQISITGPRLGGLAVNRINGSTRLNKGARNKNADPGSSWPSQPGQSIRLPYHGWIFGSRCGPDLVSTLFAARRPGLMAVRPCRHHWRYSVFCLDTYIFYANSTMHSVFCNPP